MTNKLIVIVVIFFTTALFSFAFAQDNEIFAKSMDCLDEAKKQGQGNISPCVDAIKLIENQSYFKNLVKDKTTKQFETTILPELYLNAGVLSYFHEDYKSAYNYFMFASNKESSVNNPEASKSAQHNLKILCNETPWACR